jgi:hypothetical protein
LERASERPDPSTSDVARPAAVGAAGILSKISELDEKKPHHALAKPGRKRVEDAGQAKRVVRGGETAPRFSPKALN